MNAPLGAVAGVALSLTVLLAGTAYAVEDRDCGDFEYQEDAQAYFDEQGYSADNDPEQLDDLGVGDGVACEARPRRGATAESETPTSSGRATHTTATPAPARDGGREGASSGPRTTGSVRADAPPAPDSQVSAWPRGGVDTGGW